MSKISALVLTLNEAHTIQRALSSLIFADEILVVDAQSSDATQALVLDPKAPWAGKVRLEVRAWPGFRAQRQWALEHAAHEWVFVLDADEACSPALAKRLVQLAKEDTCDAYKIRRQEFFLGEPIGYGIWNPSYQDRFFKKEEVRYVNEVHEYPVFKGQPLRIHEPIFHDPNFNVHRFLQKMNHYTTLEAKARFEAGQRTHLIHLLGAFPAMFLKNYFYYEAYRDGTRGFIISLLEGLSRAVRHIKLWSLAQK